MANAILDPKVYANVGLKILKNKLVAGKLVSGQFKNEFKKIGDTVYAKRPPEFVVREGRVADIQDVVEGETPITIDKQRGVDVEFTSVEDTLSVDALLKSKTMDSAMAQIAQTIDQDIHTETKKFYNWVGTPGQTVNSFSDFAVGPQRLDEMAVETDGRKGILHPADAWGLVGSFSGLYAQEQIANDALKRAKLPMIGDVDVYRSQNAGSVTTGTRTGGAVDGASQNVTYASAKDGNWTQTLDVKTLGTSKTLAAGEVFTIDGVYAINPRSKTALSYLQHFTVTEAITGESDGTATITISPPMITSGAFQNVSAAPSDSATITYITATASTTYTYNTLLRPESIALVSAKLSMPFTGQASYSTDKETGISVRYWRSSDSTNDTHMHRFDVLYGVKNVDPRRGLRLSGTSG